MIHRATTQDYVAIVGGLERYWGSVEAAPMHHPLLVREFGDLSLVIRDRFGVSAYLFGLLSPEGPAGYIHVVGVRTDRRREGLASELYVAFADRAAGLGAFELRAITRPGNTRSRAFHTALGFEERMAPDYSGPGEDRIVFSKPIG
ncbi:MAG: GNAT family N-acetyltransferase [Solirubrobacteraceae bacterium]|nr:GNAT family N-acetyltransferase [Solirubrobacteraceae bacterium]